MKSLLHRLSLALLIFAAVVSHATAQNDPPVGPPKPERPIELTPLTPSPAAMKVLLKRRLDHIVDVINGESTDIDSISFTEAFVQRTPRDEALRALRERGASGAKYEVLQTRLSGETSIDAWARETQAKDAFITIHLTVERSRPHRYERLEIVTAAPPGSDMSKDWREFDEMLAGRVFRSGVIAVEVGADGSQRVLHSTFPDERLGIGTMGKIFVQLALAELIDEGGASWDKMLSIDESLRSLPDTQTSLLKGGTELPLSEYARRAMLEGDNTCADHLIAHMGRERVEQARDRVRTATGGQGGGVDRLPGGEPFLTTMENYRLKCGVSTLITKYAEAGNDERRLLLANEVPKAEIDLTLLNLWQKPQELLRVGWTATPRELSEAAARLAALSVKAGNAQALDALRPMGGRVRAGAHLQPVMLRGGEPGAQAELWIDQRRDGRTIIMAAIFNIEKRPLPERETTAIVSRAVAILTKTP